MADPVHVAKLYQGAWAWNLWRDGNPQVTPDLEGLVLAPEQRRLGVEDGGPVDLRRALLSRADLRQANLTGADLSGATLVEARLDSAQLVRANFSGADLRGAVFDDADLSGANLDGAAAGGARFAWAHNLTQTQIDRCFGDPSTLIPPGLKVPANWLRRGSLQPGGAALPGASQDAARAAAKVTEGIFKTLNEAKENMRQAQKPLPVSPAQAPLSTKPKATAVSGGEAQSGRWLSRIAAGVLVLAALLLLFGLLWYSGPGPRQGKGGPLHREPGTEVAPAAPQGDLP